jgi:hypothetical protein
VISLGDAQQFSSRLDRGEVQAQRGRFRCEPAQAEMRLHARNPKFQRPHKFSRVREQGRIIGIYGKFAGSDSPHVWGRRRSGAASTSVS